MTQDQRTETSATLEALNTFLQVVPYGSQASIVSFELNAVRVEWRGVVYRISDSLSVEEVEDGMLAGSDRAILLQELLRRGKK